MENIKNGGAGSGDFNHAGNPPHVGGSEPIESRHARGFKSKSEKKDVQKSKEKILQKKREIKYRGSTVSIYPDGKYADLKIYAPKGKTFTNGDTFYTTQALTEKAEEKAKEIIEGEGKRQEWFNKKPTQEEKEDKKVAETKIIEGGIKETTDKYGRIVLSKKDSNKKVKIHKNGNYFLASYGQELKDNDGYTEFQVFPSASGKLFKTEKGAKKWALEKLKETANNSLYKHEFIEY